MIVVFKDTPHYLSKVIDMKDDCPACSLNVLGKPLVLYNISKLVSHSKKIESILLPEGFSRTADVISASYPSIQINEYSERAFVKADSELLEIPLNSLIIDSGMVDLVADQIIYPWDLLRIMERVLESELKSSSI